MIKLYNGVISGVLVLVAGFVSGITIGLLSLDPIQLRVLKDEQLSGGGSSMALGKESSYAKAFARLEIILADRHLVLVTLLLTNSIALEALPIFLDKCVSEVMAVVLSVSLVLLFGEIIPQAFCTGKYQMQIVIRAVPFLRCLIAVFWVLSFPIARLLDYLIGEAEGQTLYARSHLKALIRLHGRDGDGKPDETTLSNGGGGVGGADHQSALCADEVVVIEGALDLASKMASHVMVPIEKVFMLEESEKLTRELRAELLDRGHSRVPVYRHHRWNVRGLLYIKSLICLDSHETPVVGNFIRLNNKSPIFCHPQMSLYDLLNEFQRGRHMAFITHNPDWHIRNWGRARSLTVEHEEEWPEQDDRALIGIATLEDVIEELIQEEIYDEFDNYNSSAAAAVATAGCGQASKAHNVLPLKISFQQQQQQQQSCWSKSYDDPLGPLQPLSERLLPQAQNSISSFPAHGQSIDFATSGFAPPASTGTCCRKVDSNNLIVFKNLKTLLGINQAARKVKKSYDQGCP